MADQTARGQFLWHDLLTSDPGAAHQFYGKAVGWKSQPFEADPSYVMFAGPKGPLGGAGKIEGQPHWVAYVGTPDIAASVAKAKSLGGSVVTDITQIPNGGSYAVLKDPQGAVFGVYQYASDPGARSAPQRGEVSWYELGTSDAQAALNFYTSLFGWTEVAKHDMGAEGFYHLLGWSGAGAQNGGLFSKPAQWGPPAWTIYIRVKDMDSTVKKAKAAGATLINGPMEVPGGDWIAQFTDPQGAVFAVHVLKADLKPAAAAKPAEAAPAKAEAPKAAAPKAAAPKKKPAAKKKAAAKAKSAKTPAKKAAKKAGKKKAAAKAKKPVRKAAKKKAKAAKKKARKAK